MNYALDAHFAFAFAVMLCALFMGWIQLGRRVMSAVLGIQVALGIAVAAWDGVLHVPLPPRIWIHVASGLLAMAAYIAGRRLIDRDPSAVATGYALSFVGLALVGFTFYYGGILVAGG